MLYTQYHNQIAKMNQEVNELKAQLYDLMTKKVESVLDPLFNDFLTKYSFVKSLSWVQYTPYFNDGDECIFSVIPELNFELNLPVHENESNYYEDSNTSQILSYLNSNTVELKADRWTSEQEVNHIKERVSHIKLNYDVTDWESDVNFIQDFLTDFEDQLQVAFGDHVRVTYNGNFTTEEYDHE